MTYEEIYSVRQYEYTRSRDLGIMGESRERVAIQGCPWEETSRLRESIYYGKTNEWYAAQATESGGGN